MLIPAWILTPYWLIRCLDRSIRTPEGRGAATATAAVIVNTATPLLLFSLSIPLTRSNMILFHSALAVLSAVMTFAIHKHLPLPSMRNTSPVIAVTMLGMVVLLFPYTHFTGIDTYKWQDLASSIWIEGSIPWLAHPLSLFGFTPRSYPCAFPLMLSSAELLIGHHIEWGFYILSLTVASTALLTACFLGSIVFGSSRTASLFAAFYVLSPVFMRYSHWATGRGLFLALCPLFIGALLNAGHLKSIPLLVISAILLLVSHKVAWIFIPLALAAWACSPLWQRVQNKRGITVPALVLAGILAATIASPLLFSAPVGNLAGVALTGLIRAGWMLPFAILALISAGWTASCRMDSTLGLLTLASIPLLYETQMYDALVALPAIALAATGGVSRTQCLLGSEHPMRRAITPMLLSLSLLMAVGVIIHRSAIATPPRIREAALFLQDMDPLGPFVIDAPGRSRTQIQAYVTGCPRFNIHKDPSTGSRTSQIRVMHPPPPAGSFRETVRSWINYGRGLLEVPSLSTDWYGKQATRYVFRIDNQGHTPEDSTRIYNHNGVEIFCQGATYSP